MVSAASDLQVMDDGFEAGEIAVTARIGITKAAEKPLRYMLAKNRFVSRR
jgi:DNA-3-methyladenine glycosylase